MSEHEKQLYKVIIKIPYSNERIAKLMYDVLRIDPEPKRSFISKKLDRIDNVLIAEFTGDLAKNVRVGVSSFFDSILLCCETVKDFGEPKENYQYY